MVFVRANPFLAFVNIVLVMYLLLLVVRLAQQPEVTLQEYDVPHYFNHLVSLPVRFLQTASETVRQAVNSRRSTVEKASYMPILRGILLALPILLIFLLLLSSADLVFKKYLGSLLDINLSNATLFRWGLIVIVAALFMGAYMLIFVPASAPAKAEARQRAKIFSLGTVESTIILGSVSVLFFVFVVVQLAYFFGGADTIASTGYTYAQYARKGFFELITVAAISLLLIWLVKRHTSSPDIRQRILLKYLSGILIVEVIVIMLSAHMRLNLYEEAYGFTTLRLLSHLFIGWLAVAFGLLFWYIVREEKESQFAFRIFISVVAFFALINLINPDAFIARQNIARFDKTGKLDLHYLRDLSEDATPTIGSLLNNQNGKLRKSAANILYEQSFNNGPTHWQSANLAKQRASRILHDKAAQIDKDKSTSSTSQAITSDFYENRLDRD